MKNFENQNHISLTQRINLIIPFLKNYFFQYNLNYVTNKDFQKHTSLDKYKKIDYFLEFLDKDTNKLLKKLSVQERNRTEVALKYNDFTLRYLKLESKFGLEWRHIEAILFIYSVIDNCNQIRKLVLVRVDFLQELFEKGRLTIKDNIKRNTVINGQLCINIEQNKNAKDSSFLAFNMDALYRFLTKEEFSKLIKYEHGWEYSN